MHLTCGDQNDNKIQTLIDGSPKIFDINTKKDLKAPLEHIMFESLLPFNTISDLTTIVLTRDSFMDDNSDKF